MGKIIDPQITVEDIELSLDKNSDYVVNQKIEEIGHTIPVVKLKGYPLNMADLQMLDINVSMFNMPTFRMVLKDNNYKLQESLSNKEDRCVIFVGNKDFYVKFNGIITNVSTSYTGTINLSGIFYQKELFDYKQEGFVDTSVVDMLTKICKDTKLGLYTYDNKELETTPEYHLNPNTQQISFLSDIISTYTSNLWSIDTFGFLHVGDLNSILDKPVDKYTLNPKTNEIIKEGPQDILLTFGRNRVKPEDETKDEEKYKYEIQAESIKIETDFSLTKLQSTGIATVYTGNSSGRVLECNTNIGIENSTETENTFSGFFSNKYPLRDERINKLLYGNVITVKLQNYLVEIVPFTLVNLEIYYPQTADIDTKELKENPDGTESIDYNSEDNKEKASYRLDKTHSGKHFVAGYSYHYSKNRRGEPEKITQDLILI